MSGSVGAYNEPRSPVPSDLEIAQEAPLDPILSVAERVGLMPDDLEMYGKYKAKVHLDVRDRLKDRPLGKYIDVTAITPTPLGEGKTTTTVGLCAGPRTARQEGLHLHPPAHDGPDLRHQGRRGRRRLRAGHPDGGLQPPPHGRHPRRLASPTTCWPRPSTTTSTTATRSESDPFSITWQRVVDVNDRALRQVVIGLGGKANGYPRETGFDISVASEVMAILALTTDLEGPARAARTHRHRDHGQGAADHGRGPRGGGRDDGPAEGRAHAEPDADAGAHAGARPRGPVRQHRARQLDVIADQIALPLARLRGDRVGLRRRHRHGEVHEHQVPRVRPRARLRGPGGDDPRAQDARRLRQGRRRASRCRRS